MEKAEEEVHEGHCFRGSLQHLHISRQAQLDQFHVFHCQDSRQERQQAGESLECASPA